jgi:hypothetical protein
MTNDEIAKHATETASKMTAHILDPKMAREMFDRIYGQCLAGLSGNPMFDCKKAMKGE